MWQTARGKGHRCELWSELSFHSHGYTTASISRWPWYKQEGKCCLHNTKHAFQQQVLIKAVCVDQSIHKPEGFSFCSTPAERWNLTSCTAVAQGLEELPRLLCCSSLIDQVPFPGTSPGTSCPQTISHLAKEIRSIVLTQMKATFSDWSPFFWLLD